MAGLGRAVALVNAPFSWPNSSASAMVATMAAQLTGTSGPSRRELLRCNPRATSSLPTPLSPWIEDDPGPFGQLADLGSAACCMAGLPPTSSSPWLGAGG